MKVCVLGSGSKGNAVLADNGDGMVMIDCGLRIDKLAVRLMQANRALNRISAVLITHEHQDHIAAITEIADGYNIPVYVNEMTARAIRRQKPLAAFRTFSLGEGFGIGGFEIQPFWISHDAVCPVGYAIGDKQSKFVYATDMGFVGRDFLEATEGAGLVMIESNHDVDMLTQGKYPPFLKRRILSDRGHISNATCADAVLRISQKGTRKFILGHLSEENNLPELAFWTTAQTLADAGAKEGDVLLKVAAQHTVSDWIEVES